MLACLAALGVHARSLWNPVLFADDFGILLQSYTWAEAWANLWTPVNEHSWPLTRLATWALIQVAGRPTALPLVLAVQARLVQLACMVLVYLFVRRELGQPFFGLVAMAVFGISAVYREAVFWFAASPALPALATALLALLAAQRWRQFGRGWDLALSAFWSLLAPAWFGGGILVGPLCCLYLLSAGGQNPGEPRGVSPRVNRIAGGGNDFHPGAYAPRLAGSAFWLQALSPLLGSLAFLAVSLPLAGERILHAEHYGSMNALQAFEITTGLVNTGRSVVDNLLLGSVGIAGFACPPALVVVGLAVLTGAGVWGWPRLSQRRLLILGLGFILLNYVLIYGARAAWLYATEDGQGLRFWSRYNVFPQLGVALVVCAGLAGRQDFSSGSDQLSRGQLWGIGWLIPALLILQLPHGLLGSPVYDPEQREVLRRVEEMDARCRAQHIAPEMARAVLEPLPVPGGGHNAWSFLRGSDDPRPLTEAEAWRLLHP